MKALASVVLTVLLLSASTPAGAQTPQSVDCPPSGRLWDGHSWSNCGPALEEQRRQERERLAREPAGVDCPRNTTYHWGIGTCIPAPGTATPSATPPTRTYTPVEGPAGIIKYVPGRRPIVTVKLNDLVQARLLIDTGADSSAVKPSLLARAGVNLSRPSGHGEVTGSVGKATLSYYGVTLEVAGHRARVDAWAIDRDDDEYDGLLGRDFLNTFYVTIDDRAGTVTLVPR